MVANAIAPAALVARQIIGGYAAYDSLSGKYYSVAEWHTASQYGLWCPTDNGYGWQRGESVETPPKRKNRKRKDVPTFDESRVGCVTDVEIKWCEYRRGPLYKCPELGKEVQ